MPTERSWTGRTDSPWRILSREEDAGDGGPTSRATAAQIDARGDQPGRHRALDQMEAHRRALEDARVNLIVTLIRNRREVRATYDAFFAGGGVTGDDWMRFINGEAPRGCAARKWIPGPERTHGRKYLRVVADNTKRRTTPRTRAAPDPPRRAA